MDREELYAKLRQMYPLGTVVNRAHLQDINLNEKFPFIVDNHYFIAKENNAIINIEQGIWDEDKYRKCLYFKGKYSEIIKSKP